MADLCDCCNYPILTPIEDDLLLCPLCIPINFMGAIVTAPGEDLIARVEEERQADLERFSNDLKGAG